MYRFVTHIICFLFFTLTGKAQQLLRNQSFENLFTCTPQAITEGKCTSCDVVYYPPLTNQFNILNIGSNVYHLTYYNSADMMYQYSVTVASAHCTPLRTPFGKVFLNLWRRDMPWGSSSWGYIFLGLKQPFIPTQYYVLNGWFRSSKYRYPTATLKIISSNQIDTLGVKLGEITSKGTSESGGNTKGWERASAVFKAKQNDTLLVLTNRKDSVESGISIDNLQLYPAQLLPIRQASVCAGDSITLTAGKTGISYNWMQVVSIDTTVSIVVKDSGWYVAYIFTGDSAFVDSIYVTKGNASHHHQINYCQPPVLLQSSISTATSYNWSTGQTGSSITVNQNGTYWCMAQLQADCKFTDTFTVTAYPQPPLSLPTDTSACKGTIVELNATHPAYVNYLWSNRDTTAQTSISQTGLYIISATTANNCTQTDSTSVTFYDIPVVKLPNDTALCFGELETLILDAGKWKSYYWYPTGETTQTINALQAATYKVVITDSNNCVSTDEVAITEECPAGVFIPSAFTPEGNGVNDMFEPRGKHIQSYHITIMNRWGQEVYKGNKPWNGNIKQSLADAGVYTYVIDVKLTTKQETYKGTVTLIR